MHTEIKTHIENSHDGSHAVTTGIAARDPMTFIFLLLMIKTMLVTTTMMMTSRTHTETVMAVTVVAASPGVTHFVLSLLGVSVAGLHLVQMFVPAALTEPSGHTLHCMRLAFSP